MKRRITLRPADHPMFDGKTHVSFMPKRPPPKILTEAENAEFNRLLEEGMQATTPGKMQEAQDRRIALLKSRIPTLDRPPLTSAENTFMEAEGKQAKYDALLVMERENRRDAIHGGLIWLVIIGILIAIGFWVFQ